MKKAFLIILIVLCFTCEKKNDHCWRCKMVKVVSSDLPAENSRTVTTVDTCNITQLEIDDIEMRNTYSRTLYFTLNGSNTIRSKVETYSCECKH
jgi:hypothetical protein